jgi:hypothetical protein
MANATPQGTQPREAAQRRTDFGDVLGSIEPPRATVKRRTGVELLKGRVQRGLGSGPAAGIEVPVPAGAVSQPAHRRESFAPPLPD